MGRPKKHYEDEKQPSERFKVLARYQQRYLRKSDTCEVEIDNIKLELRREGTLDEYLKFVYSASTYYERNGSYVRKPTQTKISRLKCIVSQLRPDSVDLAREALEIINYKYNQGKITPTHRIVYYQCKHIINGMQFSNMTPLMIKCLKRDDPQFGKNPERIDFYRDEEEQMQEEREMQEERGLERVTA